MGPDVIAVAGLCCGLPLFLILFGAVVFAVSRSRVARYNDVGAALALEAGLHALGQDGKRRAWFGREGELRCAVAVLVTRAPHPAGGNQDVPMLWAVCETPTKSPLGYKAESLRDLQPGTPFEAGFDGREIERVPPAVREALTRFALSVGRVRVNDAERLSAWLPPPGFLRSPAVVIHHAVDDIPTAAALNRRLDALVEVARVVTEP